MCGIVGALGRLNEPLLEEMVLSISHRGPDNRSVFSQDSVHFGHARLTVIDLSKESNQPLWDITSRALIVFNGEIYNYKELKVELEKKGYAFHSNGDAEVLLNFYIEYGETGLSRVDGMFAFAIWDSFTKELFLARDGYGVKPLYYTENLDGFYFSSEIKALLKIPTISKKLDFDSIYRSILFLWSPGPHTIIQGIKKLPPGSFLKVKNNKISKKGFFWKWPEYSPSGTLESNMSKLDLALKESVKKQLLSDVPVGAFLSGGLDSSLVVAMAKQSLKDKQRFQCFTIDALGEEGGNDGFSDDLPYAKKVAKFLDVDLNIVLSAPSIVTELSKMIYHLDEPQADPAPLNVSLISKLAKKKGIKVLLSGSGGDDVFSGYRRHQAVILEQYWTYLPQFLRRGLKKITSCLPPRFAFTRRISKAFSYAHLPQEQRLLSYFYWIDPVLLRSLFTPKIQQEISINPVQFMLDDLRSRPEKNCLERVLYLDRKYFLVDHNLNYTDKMSMAHGVEVRVPFLDHGLSLAASKIPAKMKLKGNHGKWILKKVAERYLPKSVIYRPKTGFGAPLRKWLNSDLKPLVDEVLSVKSLDQRGIFDPKAIHDLIEKDRNGTEDYSYPLFAVLCFELWCRIFLDNINDGLDNQ